AANAAAKAALNHADQHEPNEAKIQQETKTDAGLPAIEMVVVKSGTGGTQKHHDQLQQQHGQQSCALQRQSLTLGKSLRSYGSSTTATSNKYGGRNDDKSCRDYSITQHAIIDDDNASQHQTPKYQGALTLASQWKSQFDDSDDSTDGLWKGEQHSENASKKNYTNLNKSSIAAATAQPQKEHQSALPPQPPPPPPPSQPPQSNGQLSMPTGGVGGDGLVPNTTTTIATINRNGHLGESENNGTCQPPEPPPPPTECDERPLVCAEVGGGDPVLDAVSLLPYVGGPAEQQRDETEKVDDGAEEQEPEQAQEAEEVLEAEQAEGREEGEREEEEGEEEKEEEDEEGEKGKEMGGKYGAGIGANGAPMIVSVGSLVGGFEAVAAAAAAAAVTATPVTAGGNAELSSNLKS
uniref:Uncharacterized protein n=1 Tax=Anopheles culicifacies TaxID=139723 RepID=A0A182LV55_9DIPT